MHDDPRITADTSLHRHEARHRPVSDCPVVPGNKTTLLRSGAEAIGAMLDAIDHARDHLHLEFYIFDDVRIGGRGIVDSLLAARRRGVKVAVIYDSVGSLHTPDHIIDRLTQAGVQTLEFRPVRPWRRHFGWRLDRLNDRDHRKLLVADGAIAFLGGVNLARVYENPPEAGLGKTAAESYWHDCAIRITGPAVAWAQRVFLDTWHKHGGDPLSGRTYPDPPPDGPHKIRIAASAPLEHNQLYFRALRAAIEAAEHRILLTTGYFVPARRNWKLLADAARRGVRVTLILASHSDTPATLHAARALYGRLLEAGVHIHELTDGMLHAKAATIDGVWSVIGSSNFDRRSYSFNNEVDAVLLGRDMAQQLEALLTAWSQRASKVTLAEWRKRSLNERGQEYLARLWERYM
jgi:cardiolipin synthase